ncbi:MAG: hypothetical protein ACRC8B_22755 [Aeromonas sobria]|uniref:hypothetical protein n=1 Tax=Aeromonas sobria TaxID=646 RepID=UPI003F380FEA
MDIIKFIERAGGCAKAAELFKESPRTVASWYYGEKLPKPAVVCKIIKLTKGELDYNRVYAPLIAKMADKQAQSLIKKASQE